MKRLIVTLLTVCMVVGMFAGLTVTASADYDTSDMVAYTMTAGDNVYSVCQKMGLDFWKYETVIKTVNSIKSYSSISVGAVIYFPKPGSATTISGSSSAGSSSTAGSTTPSTDSFEVKSDDKIAYYLIPHVMQTGEQIKDLCASYGVDYYSYSAKIAKINGLKSCDYVQAGTTVLIPSISAPSGECYRVIAHTIQAGDSVYNKCIEYGVNYYSSLTVLKGVNNTDNLNSIKAGNTLYVPVKGTASGSGSGSSSGSASGSTTPATGVVYNITIATAEHGTVSANVNNAAVVKAASGSEVVISAKPEKGYALDSFSVAATSGGAAVLSTDEGFTMPAFAVTVTATFRQASSYKATANTAQHGTVKLQPAGGTAAQSQKITEGTKVTVVTTADKGYTLDSIKVYNPNNEKKTVAVNGNSFIMPSHPVAVDVTFMSSDTYTVYTRKSVLNGSYWIEVDGVKTTEVNKGKTVTVCVDPAVGYEIEYVKYYQADDANADKVEPMGTRQTFVMPGYDVTVVVKFKEGTEHNITASSSGNGTVTTNPELKAKCGETVNIIVTPNKGYNLDTLTVTDANGLEIAVSEDNTFTMPSTDVTVNATFKQGKYAITLNSGENGTAKLYINGSEAPTLKANMGNYIQVKASPKPGYQAKVTATNPNGNKKYEFVYNSTYDWYELTGQMPANAMVINVSFELPSYTVYGPFVTGSGTVSLLKDGKKLDPTVAAKGDIVTVSLEPAPGCAVKSVKVVNASDKENAVATKVNELTYTFKMPAEDVKVMVEFSAPTKNKINLGTISDGKISFIVDGYPATEAAEGETVQMVITPDSGKELKNLQITKKGDANKVIAISNNSFVMPGYEVDVNGTFGDVKASTYTIGKAATANGSFIVVANSADTKDNLSAAKDAVRYIKATPKSGYVVDQISITYNNGLSTVSYSTFGSNIWEFIMVDSNVTVSVTFKTA